MHSENVLPIVAGGTSYWIQHLLFPNRLPSLDTTPGADQKHDPSPASISPALSDAISTLPPALLDQYETLPLRASAALIPPEEAFSLHTLLCHLDPNMGARWHWKDTRKVLRSLGIIKENGRLASEVIAAQQPEGDMRFVITLSEQVRPVS